MAQGSRTELAHSKRNYSKAQREALEEAEAEILYRNNGTKPKPTRKLDNSNLTDKAIKAIFNKYVRENPQLTIDDSQLLMELADYQHQYNELATEIVKLSVIDDRRVELEKRQQNVSKLISQRLKELNIARMARLAEAQAQAKLKIEQQKADGMTKEKEPENPLLAVLKKQNEKKGGA